MRLVFSLSAIPAMLLVACSPASERAEGSVGTETISCAISNAADFSDDCSVERIEGDEETLLIVRHDDGGFRRFQVLPGQGGLVAADGADEATVQDKGTFVLVTVGTDRYRIPVGTNGTDEPVG